MAGFLFDDIPMLAGVHRRAPYYANRGGYHEWPIDPMDYLRYNPRVLTRRSRPYYRSNRYFPEYLNIGFIPKGALTGEGCWHEDGSGDESESCCLGQLAERCPCQALRRPAASYDETRQGGDGQHPTQTWEPLKTLQQLVRHHSQHNNDDEFQIKIDARGFRPEEIDVKLVNGDTMLVQGQHKVETENGFEHRMIKRCVRLPRHVDSNAVASKLDKDGFLLISAPVAQALTCGEEKTKEESASCDEMRSCCTSTERAEESESTKEPAEREADCGSCAPSEFKVQFNTAGFRPNEISVKQMDNVLMLTAQHATQNDSQFRFIRRCVSLPQNVDCDALRTKLSKEGLLTITAPWKNAEGGVLDARELKMEMEGEEEEEPHAAVTDRSHEEAADGARCEQQTRQHEPATESSVQNETQCDAESNETVAAGSSEFSTL